METSYVILRRHGGIRTHPARMSPSSRRRGEQGGGDQHPLKPQGEVGWSPAVPPHMGTSSEAAGRAACPGRAEGGRASLGDSWEQLVALGQSYSAASPSEQMTGNSLQGAEVNTCPPPHPSFPEMAPCAGEGLQVPSKGLG